MNRQDHYNSQQRVLSRYFLQRPDQLCTERDPARCPWWHSSLIGYPLALVFVGAASLLPLIETPLGIRDYFVEPPFVIATLLVGWLWGPGPSLFALLLEILAVDFWVIPPLQIFTFFQWPDIISFAQFVILQLVVLGLIMVQKSYRRQLLQAQCEMAKRAEELAEKNQELAQSNALLEQANRFKDQFLGQASHELKTPITTIQGQVQLALRHLARSKTSPVDPSSLSVSLAKVEKQTHRLNELVNTLLNLSSLRSGKIPLYKRPCDLSRLCREIAEDLQGVYERCIHLKVSPDPLLIQADEDRLSQVVINLLTNAAKYSPASSLIDMEVSQEPAGTLLAVHNEGSVLTPEQQAAIFEPFYRTSEIRQSTIQGWGLGLSISRAIIEQHGGRIWVESSEEKGTMFLVELPTNE